MEKNMYTSILIQSLEKKLKVLESISFVNYEQKNGLEDPNLDPDDFDKVMEKKAVLIDELNKLDEGFEEIFAKVKNDINANRECYKEEIRTMQELVRRITDKSVMIQREEQQNKTLMEQKFAAVRKQAKEVRQSQKIVNQYYKNMMKSNYIDPQFMDNKK